MWGLLHTWLIIWRKLLKDEAGGLEEIKRLLLGFLCNFKSFKSWRHCGVLLTCFRNIKGKKERKERKRIESHYRVQSFLKSIYFTILGNKYPFDNKCYLMVSTGSCCKSFLSFVHVNYKLRNSINLNCIFKRSANSISMLFLNTWSSWYISYVYIYHISIYHIFI